MPYNKVQMSYAKKALKLRLSGLERKAVQHSAFTRKGSRVYVRTVEMSNSAGKVCSSFEKSSNLPS